MLWSAIAAIVIIVGARVAWDLEAKRRLVSRYVSVGLVTGGIVALQVIWVAELVGQSLSDIPGARSVSQNALWAFVIASFALVIFGLIRLRREGRN